MGRNLRLVAWDTPGHGESARVRLLPANSATLTTEMFGEIKIMTLPWVGELMNKFSAKAAEMQTKAILHGAQDKVLAVKHSRSAHALVVGSELVVLENCGRAPQFERPEIFNEKLTALALCGEA